VGDREFVERVGKEPGEQARYREVEAFQQGFIDGEPIVVINRESGSQARSIFAEQVFGADRSWLAGYWNEQYFQGIFPPATRTRTWSNSKPFLPPKSSRCSIGRA
jgi:hypothetical protein